SKTNLLTKFALGIRDGNIALKWHSKIQAIVEYRQKNGSFKNIDEIKNVKGIGPAIFEKNKSRLAL
ncbi:MAG: helix-hairpin-helix domain-containing protein, partial [Acinetobacter baumannii]|nr:helix-hairpin-helix domain-containing protein [Acinetobacter baumannii]